VRDYTFSITEQGDVFVNGAFFSDVRDEEIIQQLLGRDRTAARKWDLMNDSLEQEPFVSFLTFYRPEGQEAPQIELRIPFEARDAGKRWGAGARRALATALDSMTWALFDIYAISGGYERTKNGFDVTLDISPDQNVASLALILRAMIRKYRLGRSMVAR